MSLEAAIEANTAALRELISALARGIPTTSAQVAAVVTEVEQSAAAALKDAEVVEDKKSEPAKTETKAKPEVKQDTAKAAPVTFDDVARAITALAKKDRQAAIKLLSDFGARKGQDLAPAQFADFHAQATTLIAEAA